ncbi:MAG TPA: pyrroline-5-carboxylate reductase [Stellaceae bacterium]|nr:pyrroline-5-carboxylate reductase [Stellaceae bacterium]
MNAEAVPALLLVGCGKMGGALLRGWLDRSLAQRLVVVEPGPAATAFAGAPGVELLASADALPADFIPGVIVLAVKPQVMAEALPAYRRFAEGGVLVLSIAAGKTLGFFARALGAEAAVIRAMPNTPAAIGRGIAVACANARVTPAQRTLAERLLGAVGEVCWVAEEPLIDAVTAVSGSGPAYVFLLIECLAKAGAAAGLPADLASRLARATVAGSGELARLSPESAAALREAVTSPGGTTRAALDVLMAKDGLEPLLRRAVLAAAKRSRELAD